MTSNVRKTYLLSEYQPTPYGIKHVELKFELAPTATLVTNRMQVFKRQKGSKASLELAGKDLSLEGIVCDGRPLPQSAYRLVADGDELHIDAPTADSFELIITTKINPQDNLALEGLYLSSGNFCTQCEAEGFRRITYFYDRPDVMATYRVTVIADKKRYPILLSNGNCLDRGELSDNRHYTVWDDPFPKPAYLFALVAGDFAELKDSFRTRSGRNVELAIYAKAHDIDKCEFGMLSLKHAMRWDEEVFGLECDLDHYKIVAIGDFNMGAMENKGLNIFNTALVLAKPETATDANYAHIEAVIGHEYFHNWTGNRVTCRDWFQLCLKEGLTVFRDQEFSSDRGSRAVKRIEDVEHLRVRQWPEDDGPMSHPPRPDRYIEINNFYTTTVYYKGAEVVRMLHTLIGKDAFRKGMDLYFKRYDGMAVTQEDFVDAMATASGKDLKQFMRWYTEKGTPTVVVKQAYDEKAATLTLSLTQKLPAGSTGPRHIPLVMGLLGRDGREMPLQLASESKAQGTHRLFSLTREHEELVFTHVTSRPVASLFRNFSAAVKVEADLSDADLQFLISHDRDPFTRWDSAQNLYTRAILALVDDQQKKRPLRLAPTLQAAFASLVAGEPEDDPAFRALALSLPGEKILAQAMKVVDVDAIYTAREFVRTELAKAFAEPLLKLYHAMQDKTPTYSSEPTAVARRSLKNRCLRYLHALGDQHGAMDLIHKQWERANNMTDVDCAFGLLVDSASPRRGQAVADFYKKWKHEDLVIDRWFSTQASAHQAQTLDEVEALLKHPDFNLVNPNRIRALLGSVCHGNPTRFHELSGRGYRLCADYVIKLDRSNRQIASYLARAFDQWRRYEPTRQGLMKGQLQRILDTPQLSPDVYEVVSKALQAQA